MPPLLNMEGLDPHHRLPLRPGSPGCLPRRTPRCGPSAAGFRCPTRHRRGPPSRNVPAGTRTNSMPVTGSTLRPASPVCGSAAADRASALPARNAAAARRAGQPRAALRADFPVVLDLDPAPGAGRRPSGVSHIGHTFQVSLTGSPQAGHFYSLSMLAARSSNPDFPHTMSDLRVNLYKFPYFISIALPITGSLPTAAKKYCYAWKGAL